MTEARVSEFMSEHFKDSDIINKRWRATVPIAGTPRILKSL